MRTFGLDPARVAEPATAAEPTVVEVPGAETPAPEEPAPEEPVPSVAAHPRRRRRMDREATAA
jgi:hypothetical protein